MTCCGSPAYAAPELIQGKAYIGSEVRDDAFSNYEHHPSYDISEFLQIFKNLILLEFYLLFTECLLCTNVTQIRISITIIFLWIKHLHTE